MRLERMVHLENQGFQARLGRLERRDLLGHPVMLEKSEKEVNKGPRELQDVMERMDRQENLGCKENQVRQAKRDSPVKSGNLETQQDKEDPELLVKMGFLVLTVRTESLDCKGSKEHPVSLERTVQTEKMALLVHKEPRGIKATKAPKVLRVSPDCPETWVSPVFQVHQAQQVLPEILGCLVFPEWTVKRELLA